MFRLKNLLRLSLLALVSTSWAAVSPQPFVVSNVVPPEPMREFRGVWVATVKNIDWPSRPGLSTQEQKAELVALMEKAAQMKFNAVILQIRPATDALYASNLEPWSEYLSGAQGQPPRPFYDPLAFAVTEAHARGLELHAWFNPYRARHPSATSPNAKNHISKTQPRIVRTYGQHLWLDPGEKAVQDHSVRVIMDVVKRYPIDAVHMDDYFYPYQEKDSAGRTIDFPDEPSWQKYRKAGGKLARDDWRRQNVDTFVKRLYREIKAEKPAVKFGISPFGIWRPGYPPQIKGLDAYEKLYADARKWFREGWVDYLTPQLYWGIEPKEQSYPVLMKWWAEQNGKDRHLWPGMNDYKVGAGWKSPEIINQIRLTREFAGASGNAHWSMAPLMANKGNLASELQRTVYAEPALIPASPWLDKKAPARPKIEYLTEGSSAGTLLWKGEASDPPALWLVQTRKGGTWKTEIRAGGQSGYKLGSGANLPEIVSVRAVDRAGNCSPAAVLARKP